MTEAFYFYTGMYVGGVVCLGGIGIALGIIAGDDEDAEVHTSNELFLTTLLWPFALVFMSIHAAIIIRRRGK